MDDLLYLGRTLAFFALSVALDAGARHYHVKPFGAGYRLAG